MKNHNYVFSLGIFHTYKGKRKGRKYGKLERKLRCKDSHVRMKQNVSVLFFLFLISYAYIYTHIHTHTRTHIDTSRPNMFTFGLIPFRKELKTLPLQLYMAKSAKWGLQGRIHWLHLCRGVSLPLTRLAQSAGAAEYSDCISVEGEDTLLQRLPGSDTKQSDGEAPVMLERWGMQSTPSLPLIPGSLWPGVVTPDRVLSKRVKL